MIAERVPLFERNSEREVGIDYILKNARARRGSLNPLPLIYTARRNGRKVCTRPGRVHFRRSFSFFSLCPDLFQQTRKLIIRENSNIVVERFGKGQTGGHSNN